MDIFNEGGLKRIEMIFNMAELYQTLNINVPVSDIKKNDKLKLLKVSKKFNKDEAENFFILIYEHYRRSLEYDVKNIYPYGLKCNHNELIIDIGKLPIQLRHILLRFTNLKTDL